MLENYNQFLVKITHVELSEVNTGLCFPKKQSIFSVWWGWLEVDGFSYRKCNYSPGIGM